MKTINNIVEYIVPKTLALVRRYVLSEEVEINYCAIFCQNEEEYKELEAEASGLGEVVDDTPTGPLYRLQEPLETVAGPLYLIKIRKPDPVRPQRGDADFTLKNYEAFKKKHAGDTEHFKVINRDTFEMIELRDSKIDVLVYFSNPPLTKQFSIT
ncbi:MAG: hypothetical protein WEC84_01090 [Candidatus Andersenbacteria bacterium]